MIVKDKNIKQRDIGSDKLPGHGVSHGMCLPSMSPIGLSVPKGCINSESRSGVLPTRFVPVVDKNNIPLMPTKASRARSWIKARKATPFYIRGILCVRLNQDPSSFRYQEITCAIDPGSKKEGYTFKSTAHTYFNIQADAVTWVEDAVTTRREMRNGRRSRKTPCRQPRFHRKRGTGWMPPSIKARWAWKIRIVNTFKRMLHITVFVVENIKAKTKDGKRKWNLSFSPLQIGKHWFYQELRKLGKLILKGGYDTNELRYKLGLKKSKKKLEESWSAHCVDSWAMAWSIVGGHTKPDNTDMIYISPIRLHRRQLHALQPVKGGNRRPYGGTRSMGLKRGSLVNHKTLGICYIGGSSRGLVTFYDIHTQKLSKRRYRIGDCRILTWNTWRIWANSPLALP